MGALHLGESSRTRELVLALNRSRSDTTMTTNGTTPTDQTLPPQNLEAEESVLGALLVAEGQIPAVLLDVRLTAEDFYRERHRLIFTAIRELHDRGEAVDALTVSEALTQRGELEEAGGRDQIATLAATVPAAGNARHYGRIVKQNALLRRLLNAAQTIQQSVNERAAEPRQLAEDAERLLYQVANEEHMADFRRIGDVLGEEIDKLEALARGGIEMTGTPSGFTRLDELTGGFQPGNLVILAARPAMGKSTLVANIAQHVALKAEKPVALFSLEMSQAELGHRFIASEAQIPGDDLRKGKVKGRGWQKVVRACEAYSESPLWIDDSSDISLLELRAKARRLHSQEGLALIAIDYLQLMRPSAPSTSRVEQVSAISRGLKVLARELEVPVIALSQLSRAVEQRPDKRPVLSDLRESGQIEQDADLVCFLYNEEYYRKRGGGDDFEEPEPSDDGEDGNTEVLIAKHRNGPIGTVKLVFNERYPRFFNPAGSRERSSLGSPEAEMAAQSGDGDEMPF